MTTPTLTMQWVLSIDPKDADALVSLFGTTGLEVCEHEDLVWVRGSKDATLPSSRLDVSKHPKTDLANDNKRKWSPGGESIEPLERVVRGVYGATHYDVLSDGQLVPSGRQVPTAKMPTRTTWIKLEEWIQPELPPAALAGRLKSNAPVSLRLVRVEQVDEATTKTKLPGSSQAPNLLICSLNDWHEFATTASLVRLKQLRFAFDPDQGVIVRGNPLPPIIGNRYVESESIATPLGWTWTPNVSRATLARVLNLQPDHCAILVPPARSEADLEADSRSVSKSDGTISPTAWYLIPDSQFVAASRASARATLRRHESQTADEGESHE